MLPYPRAMLSMVLSLMGIYCSFYFSSYLASVYILLNLELMSWSWFLEKVNRFLAM